MYKLLIVDDEEIEREGMANFIPWKEHEIELVGAAWNGVQGLEMIEKYRPDIVLVDVKMPVMNGLEMIRQAKQSFQDVVYVILSGFGEYEFTSQAMEQGVRHYILKPCDEQKILDLLVKVKEELQENAERKNRAKNVRLLMPRAKEQIFCGLLQGHVRPDESATQYFMSEMGGAERPVQLVDVRLSRAFDYLERFVIGNIMNDLLPPQTLLCSGGIDKDTFLLVSPEANSQLEKALTRLQTEFRRFEATPLQIAISMQGCVGNLSQLHGQVTELLSLNETMCNGILRFGAGENLSEIKTIFDYRSICSERDYEQLLLKLYTGFSKMRLQRYSVEKQKKLATLAWKLLAADEPLPELDLGNMAHALAVHLKIIEKEERDRTTQQMWQIYEVIYQHMSDPDLNLMKLAHDYLYISEDYLSRLFIKRTGIRLTSFLENRRIEVARALMEFAPQTTNTWLAELVGYQPDGRYFARAFRKQFGMTPNEYKERLLLDK